MRRRLVNKILDVMIVAWALGTIVLGELDARRRR